MSVFVACVDIDGIGMNINNVISYKGQTQPPVTSSNQSPKPTKTSIFYINDLHGQIPKMQRLFSAAQHVDLIGKQNGADVLKFSSGDTFIGEDIKRNTVASTFLKMSGIDAEALGNHEFDITATKCRELLRDSKTKLLGMNLNFPQPPCSLAQNVDRSTIIKGENGEMYGVIGIQPPDLETRVKDKAKLLEGITVDNEQQTIKELQQEVDMLKKQGINKIVLLSHTGNKFEKKVAQSVSGIDVILGGHSHDLIKGVKEGENLLYSPNGEPVVITQAGRDGNNFGVLNLEFNENGQITSVQNNIIDTNVYSPNLIMSKTVDSIVGKSPVIGSLKYVDPLPGNIMEENPWADFVSDAMKNTHDADIALVNSANFRGSVDLGTITERDIYSIFPFENKLVKVKLSEKDLVDAIKHCAKTLINENNKPGILQVSGLEYTMNKKGEVLDVTFVDKTGNKQKIDVNNPNPNKEYSVVYDEFLLNGGDKCEMLKRDESQIIQRYEYDKDKVTIDYIKSLQQPFEVRKDGRIKIVD